jgi:hypothetical protein
MLEASSCAAAMGKLTEQKTNKMSSLNKKKWTQLEGGKITSFKGTTS